MTVLITNMKFRSMILVKLLSTKKCCFLLHLKREMFNWAQILLIFLSQIAEDLVNQRQLLYKISSASQYELTGLCSRFWIKQQTNSLRIHSLSVQANKRFRREAHSHLTLNLLHLSQIVTFSKLHSVLYTYLTETNLKIRFSQHQLQAIMASHQKVWIRQRLY